ncbi:hypothetical protein H2200_003097 [Cladophialophora chaetospira]|uniref:Uncharacterized protein n=1 Tax=Cladophialophora chaetospira TaxID=386627 RepID=A0AA38XHF0_9EURO|nr:hypothetical protein H2200_003097 [Cladophialophora chaetospira]
MVLLTPSTVSAMISGSVVCLFTFLLFLSGYVLQQQSVRSIQEAIRRPPEPKPVPTLPARFRHVDDVNETVGVVLEQPGAGFVDGIQVPVLAPSGGKGTRKDPTPRNLAYFFALEEPRHLCSALLFAKHHRSTSRLAKDPSIVLLYPSTWESDSSSLYTSTLNFMRDVQELYDLIYHPVNIHRGWGDRALLLGELQHGNWGYDQALYLRSPGVLLDTQALDSLLASADTRQSWAPLNPSSGNNPEVLLKTNRGWQSPRGLTRKLVLSSSVNSAQAEEDQESTRESREEAAYILLDGPPSDEENVAGWYSDLKKEFDKGIASVCEASGLL